jgi:hypothetical protein
MLRTVHENHERHEKIPAVGLPRTASSPAFICILQDKPSSTLRTGWLRSKRPACSERCRLDLPGFTTAMDGGSAGAAGSGSSKNLEGLTGTFPI